MKIIDNTEAHDAETCLQISSAADRGKIYSLRLKTGMRSPQIEQEENLLVLNGDKFTFVSVKHGLIGESNYLNKQVSWVEAFAKVAKVKHVKGRKTIVIGNPGHRNYYHWTFQIWMALIFIKENYVGFSDCQVLGPALNGWRKQYIELLGDLDYIEADPNCAYVVDHAIYSDVTWGGFSFLPCHQILNLVDKISVADIGGAKKIFISRRDTQKRGLTNEVDVTKLVERYGYETVLLSDLTIVQQISLFRNAKSIIAPHGAGLTNTIFSRPGTEVIELFPDDYVNPCFYSIAISRELIYAASVNPVMASNDYHSSAMTVDVPLLERIIINQNNK